MSFASGFYTFIGKIYVNADESKFAIKTPRHPDETLTTLQSRILSYILYNHDEMVISSGLFEPEAPTAFTKSFEKPYETSIALNVRTEKALKKLKQSSEKLFLTFESQDTCKDLIKHISHNENIPQEVEILPPLFLTEETNKFEITCTIVEETVYLTINETSFDFERKYLSRNELISFKFEETQTTQS